MIMTSKGWLTRLVRVQEFFSTFYRVEWWTSGRKDSGTTDQFYWESDGTKVSGTQFWLASDSRTGDGDIIVYHTNGKRL